MSARFEASPQRSNEAERNAEAEIEKVAKSVERAPIPPEALRGFEGMEVADEMLKKLGVVGLLIGGLAKRICLEGEIDPSILESHKDVDVLIPSIYSDHKYHPKQWENGIDWWISHADDEAPTNGATNLIQAPTIDESWENEKYKDRSGLYICPPNVLLTLEKMEQDILGIIKDTPKFENEFNLRDFSSVYTDENKNRYKRLYDALRGFEYPLFSEQNIMIQGGCTTYNHKPVKPLQKKAIHCKPK
jgi:hypothetical protein